MGLFGKKKQEVCSCGGNCETKEVKKEACSCGGNCETVKVETEKSVKVLGSGCAKCNELEKNTVEALKQLGMDTAIEHVKDFAVIATYGVMQTPALVVDGKVVAYGKVLKTEEVVKILQKTRG